MPIVRIAADVAFDGEAVFAKMPPCEGGVASIDTTRGECGREQAVRPIGFRDDQQTRRFLVESMHDAGTFIAAFRRELPASADECVHESAGPVSWCRMHNHSGGLVNHEEVFVLEHDADWQRLADDVDAAWCRDGDGYLLGHCRAISGLLRLAIDRDHAGRDERGGLRTRQIGRGRDDQIEALTVTACFDRQCACELP